MVVHTQVISFVPCCVTGQWRFTNLSIYSHYSLTLPLLCFRAMETRQLDNLQSVIWSLTSSLSNLQLSFNFLCCVTELRRLHLDCLQSALTDTDFVALQGEGDSPGWQFTVIFLITDTLAWHLHLKCNDTLPLLGYRAKEIHQFNNLQSLCDLQSLCADVLSWCGTEWRRLASLAIHSHSFVQQTNNPLLALLQSWGDSLAWQFICSLAPSVCGCNVEG